MTEGGTVIHAARIMLVSVMICASLTLGCSGADSEASDEMGEFASAVVQADEAMAAGDAKLAFDFYTEALEMSDANDSDGSVAERQDFAKHVFLARGLLDGDTSEYEVKPAVTVIVEHSVAETETAEAKRRISVFVIQQRDAMLAEITDVRSEIQSGQSYKVPFTANMVNGMKEQWSRDFDRLSGEYGTAAQAALTQLLVAADQANACTTRSSASEAVADLDGAESTLQSMQAQLDTLSALSP